MVYQAVRHAGFFADLVVEDQVIVEVKAVETVSPAQKKQLLTYLKLADMTSVWDCLIKNGITRIVHGLKEGSLGVEKELRDERQLGACTP